jgi:hypothetical protein
MALKPSNSGAFPQDSLLIETGDFGQGTGNFWTQSGNFDESKTGQMENPAIPVRPFIIHYL